MKRKQETLRKSKIIASSVFHYRNLNDKI